MVDSVLLVNNIHQTLLWSEVIGISEKIIGTGKPLETTAYKILIVDDSIENLQLLADTLATDGYLPLIAGTAQDALQILLKEKIHLIIAGALMPEIDGFQLCRMVKNNPQYKNLPYFISTDEYPDKEAEESGYKIGVDRYVYKKEGYKQLLNTIQEIMDDRYGIDDQALRNCKSKEHETILIKNPEEKIKKLEEYTENLRKINNELRVSEARYRSLFENASVPIVILDCETGTIVDVNNRAEHLLEYTKEELMGLSDLPFVEPHAEANKVFWTEKYVSGETTIHTKNGINVDVHITGVHIKEPDDPRIILYLQDISENKRFQQKLREIEKMALMGQLAAGIAHEIRNPLAGVSVNLQYLLQNYITEDRIRQSINLAFEGVCRLEEVIEKTLSLARTKPPSFTQENINDIIMRTLEYMRVSFKQKRITVTKKLSDKLPRVFIDDKQIQQVLLNVYHNALDAVRLGGAIQVYTKLKSNSNGDDSSGSIIVKIMDNGVGITQEELDKIFEPFHTTKSGGTGLGLAISKYIMDRHDAHIAIDSIEGKGTTVTLQFPVQYMEVNN